MPREILGDVVNPSVRVGTRKWYTVPVSIAGHALVLGALAAVPVWSAYALPLPQSVMTFLAPPPPRTPPALPTLARTARTPQPLNRDAAPLEAPATIGPEPAPAPPRELGVARGIDTSGLLFGAGPTVTIGPPPAPAPAVTPVRVGGAIQPPRLLTRVDPVYPAIARSAHLEGSVVVEATIARDGSVKDVKVLKSTQSLLDKAALDAVARWKYSPTILNGETVEVLLNVTVTFTLR